MKTFKDLPTFEKELKISLCWEDYFKIGNLTYKIYEYGSLENYDYVYFYNKFSKTMICINYDCPSSKFENGKRIIIKKYKFRSLEIDKDPYLWRTDTL